MKHGIMTKKEVQVYADEEEVGEMRVCHRKSVKLLRAFLEDLDHLDTLRALDVAAGDGISTRDVL